jgi:hypothetical protein
VLTDVSDQALAQQIGLNFAPKLANSSRGCPGCVQALSIPENILSAGAVSFKGTPDFTPDRLLVPGPAGFPVQTVRAGSVAGPFYTPYVQVAGTNIVYNAPIIATGDGPFDVTTHRNTHDRVLAIDTANMTVDLLIIRAFSAGKEVAYLSFDSSSQEAAVLERSTFTPVLEGLPFPNGEFRTDGARAAIFAFANGQTGTSSPPAQGLNHLVVDGRNVEEAQLANTALLTALRNGGDARNVLDVFPTMIDPRFRLEYSPAWDLRLTFWSSAAVASGINVAQTDSNVIRTLATQWVVGSPGGLFLASANIEVNCPVVAFINDPPLMPAVPSPFRLPLPFHDPPPTLSFNAGSAQVNESAFAINLTVTRSDNDTGEVSVDINNTDGTASERSDYTVANKTVRFAVGETSKTFTLLITDDALVEGAETFTITLANPTGGATLSGQTTVAVTIQDNDTSAPATNPIDDAQFFVSQHYSDFLSREPDAGGLSYWSSQLTACGSDQQCLRSRRVAVSNAFFFEMEYQQTAAYVFRLYRAAFGNNQPNSNPDTSNSAEARKLPSFAVFSSDRARVLAGTSLAESQLELANVFTQRPEFNARYSANMSGPDFIDAILSSIRDDSGTDLSGQRGALLSLLSQGGRGAVLYRLADDNLQTNPINNRAFIDAEYNRAFVVSEYFGYLRRDPDIAGFLFWLGQVNRFPPRNLAIQNSLACSFLTSREYQERFSSIITHSNRECL